MIYLQNCGQNAIVHLNKIGVLNTGYITSLDIACFIETGLCNHIIDKLYCSENTIIAMNTSSFRKADLFADSFQLPFNERLFVYFDSNYVKF